MSFDDFCKLEFDEFESICKAWRESREADYRDSWERARLLAAICIQPHIKKKITPKQLIPMPWDNVVTKQETPQLTAEERRKRFEALSQI